MDRSQFLKSTALGVGTLSLGFMGHAITKNRAHKDTASTLNRNLRPLIVKNEDGDKQIVLGDHQTVKLSGKDTYNQFTLIEQYNEPGMEIPLHVHQDEDEIFHVLEGELEIQVGSELKTLKAGDLGFCPRGIPHSWKVVGEHKAKVLLSVFPSGIELMFKEFAKFPPGPPNFEKVAEICAKYNIKFV